jgi:ABC-type nitrate/sulfonate/bicarbonate transport system ATPase subunit
LLDEPTSGVDPQSRSLIRNIRRLARESDIVLYTTHYMEEAESLAMSWRYGPRPHPRAASATCRRRLRTTIDVTLTRPMPQFAAVIS